MFAPSLELFKKSTEITLTWQTEVMLMLIMLFINCNKDTVVFIKERFQQLQVVCIGKSSYNYYSLVYSLLLSIPILSVIQQMYIFFIHNSVL